LEDCTQNKAVSYSGVNGGVEDAEIQHGIENTSNVNPVEISLYPPGS